MTNHPPSFDDHADPSLDDPSIGEGGSLPKVNITAPNLAANVAKYQATNLAKGKCMQCGAVREPGCRKTCRKCLRSKHKTGTVRCGVCREVGHNRQTCPKNEE
jgi:hypothetical protein